MNTKEKGDIAETRAIYEFVKRNIPVAIPYGDNQRYDIVAEFNGKLNRIQVKMANEERNGSICCYARSSTNHTTNKTLSTYENDVDYFVFFNMEYDIIALVPIADIGSQRQINLRIRPPLIKPSGVVHYFSDYSFDKTLCVETLHDESTAAKL